MLLIYLVLNLLKMTLAWDKDNNICKLDYEVNVTQEALCCQSLQPNKGLEKEDLI